MFQRQNYSNLNGVTKPVATNGSSLGRRAFGRDVTNANGNIANSGKSRMHADNSKKLKNSNQAPIVVAEPPQSRTYSTFGRTTSTSTNDDQKEQRKPLLPTFGFNKTSIKTTVPMQTSEQPTNDVNPESYQYNGKIDNIDDRCKEDPLCATDYVQDMYDLFKTKEGLTQVLPHYIDTKQTHITEKMRSILIDWLVEVHMKFKLVPETLFLCINLTDRYLERQEVSRSKLQLVGVSCLLLATKYEEIYPPCVSELVYICDNAYSRVDIIEMETQILRTLEYKITQPSAHTFLVRYLKAGHADRETTHLACYLLDGTLHSYAMLNYLPSQLAAASVFLARHATGRHPWSPTLLEYAEYTQEEVAPVARALLEEKSAASPDLNSVNKKYSSHRFSNVASKPLTFDF